MFHQPSADSGMIFDPRLPVPLQIDRSWFDDLAGRLDKGGPWVTIVWPSLPWRARNRVSLQALKNCNASSTWRLIPAPHQTDTARRVLFEMSGRAILADEVGLGKTIEAGLILKEYIVRGLVSKVLILVPASLVNGFAS